MATVIAKRLRPGDLVRLESAMGVVKVEYDHGITPAKIFVRPTEEKSGLFGLKKRWKTWEELSTPIRELSLESEIETVGSLGR